MTDAPASNERVAFERGCYVIMELMQAYERRIRSDCTTPEQLAAEPWRCAEYIKAERYLKAAWTPGQPPVETGARFKVGDRVMRPAHPHYPHATVTVVRELRSYGLKYDDGSFCVEVGEQFLQPVTTRECDHDLQNPDHTMTMKHDVREGMQFASTATCQVCGQTFRHPMAYALKTRGGE